MGKPALGITKGIHNWIAQQQSVERVTDNAAYTSVHPDDTLVLAGPPRAATADQNAFDGIQSMLAIGMLQTFQITSQKPTQPMAAIGSGRSYFVSGKSQTTWRIGRLFCNGRNLLRVLYHNMVVSGADVSRFDDPAAYPFEGRGNTQSNFFINLDSELFYVPFGLIVIFQDKIHGKVGGFYAELCMLNTYTLGFTAGQNMIMEDVGGMCDRLLPYTASKVEEAGVQLETIDRAIGFDHGADIPEFEEGYGVLDAPLNNSFESPTR